MEIKNEEGLKYLQTIENNSIDLILTDPPYIISKETGMNKLYVDIKNNSEGIQKKTLEEWNEYKQKNNIINDDYMNNYIKYGTIYGKKYGIKTDFDDWDSNFTLDILELFIKEFYNKLKKGGTCIIFFDIWKISYLKELMEKYKFKQIRLIEWIKTNPQPRNSKINYLTNSREIALLGIKINKPIFNSSYDNGLYYYPLQSGKYRTHPTQKSLELFEELIKKHSNKNNIILDPFLGSGTTAVASKKLERQFKGCEVSKEFYDKTILYVNAQL